MDATKLAGLFVQSLGIRTIQMFGDYCDGIEMSPSSRYCKSRSMVISDKSIDPRAYFSKLDRDKFNKLWQKVEVLINQSDKGDKYSKFLSNLKQK